MSDCDYIFKALLLGDPKEETRNLVEKYFQTFSLSDLKLTIGVDFYLRNLELDDKKIKLQMWNIFSQESFKLLYPYYFQGAGGALYIFDDKNQFPFTSLDEWLSIIKKEVGNELKGFAFIMVKSITKSTGFEMISFQEGLKIAKLKGLDNYFECNFKTGENVDKTLKELTSIMMEDYHKDSPYGFRRKAKGFIRNKLFNKAVECLKKLLNYILIISL